MAGVAHVGLGCGGGGFGFVAVEAFMKRVDFVVEPGNKAFEVDEVGLFGDEHAVVLGHVHDAELEGGGLVIAEETVAERDLV